MHREFLSLDEIVEMHEEQIVRYGGAMGIRDVALLESAVAMPQATFAGAYLHASIPSMAAADRFHLCQNHPFLDDNKRIAANAAITFLLLNDWDLELSWEELVDLVMRVASGDVDKSALTAVLPARCAPLS
jgi:death-on-curing protein